MAGFNTAVTGIKATTTALDVTGNNIANASTTGFKSTRAEFGDIYATQVVGAGSQNIAGAGVLISDLSQDFSSGTIEFTNSNLDLAINGSGFFQLSDGQGGTTYTRAGAFELDKEGNIVSKNGKYLQGYGLDPQGNILPVENLKVEEKESPPHATENISLSVNLQPDAELEERPDYYDKNNASSFTYTTTVETYDSLGNTQAIKFNYVEQKPQREIYEFELTPTGLVLENGTLPTSSLPVADKTADVLNISDVPVAWATILGGAAAAPVAPAAPATVNDPPNVSVFYPDAATIAAIEAADPRIDTSTITYEISVSSGPTTTHRVSYKLFSEATGQGDMVVQLGADPATPNLVEQPVSNLTPNGDVALVDANEELRFALAPADLPGPATPTAFDNGADSNDDDALRAQTTVNIGGVDIVLAAGLSRDQVGEVIVDQYAGAIKERDPAIESVAYDTLKNEIVITWKPEAGDVYSDGSDSFELVGDVSTSGPDSTSTVFSADASKTDWGDEDAVNRTVIEGDNTYLGTYRVYAYLNDDQLLDIGKQADPTEVGDPALNGKAGSTEPGPIIIKFSSATGLMESINGEDVKDQDSVPTLTIRGSDLANPNDDPLAGDLDNLRGVQFDVSGTTRWNSDSIVKGQEQDGYAKGDLIGVSFDERGYMVASYSNGQKQEIGIVAMATFENQSGLQPSGDTEWVPTLDSGQASLNPPGTGLNGTIRSGALEQSNVDLSAELVKLIEFQRNYQANSKTLETLNTVTQSILQI